MCVHIKSSVQALGESRVLLTELSMACGLSLGWAGGGILIWAQAVGDQEVGPGASVALAVLAACAELDHVFHSPLSVSPAGEELRFPVLQTNK